MTNYMDCWHRILPLLRFLRRVFSLRLENDINRTDEILSHLTYHGSIGGGVSRS
jgi:hypothetical protein